MVPKTIVVRELVFINHAHMHAYQVVARCSQVYNGYIGDEGG